MTSTHTIPSGNAARTPSSCTSARASVDLPAPPIPTIPTTGPVERPVSSARTPATSLSRGTNRDGSSGSSSSGGRSRLTTAGDGPPGNATGRGIARRPGGNGGALAGFARPPDTARRAASRRIIRAASSPIPIRSTPTTWRSSPGRSQAATRATSSFRSCPAGSATHAACHSAVSYTDRA